MRRSKLAFASAAIIAIGLVGLALVAAPRACKGGFEVYFWTGCVALLVLVVLPFAARLGSSWTRRVAWAASFLALGAAAWLIGLFSANVRFICGLGYL